MIISRRKRLNFIFGLVAYVQCTVEKTISCGFIFVSSPCLSLSLCHFNFHFLHSFAHWIGRFLRANGTHISKKDHLTLFVYLIEQTDCASWFTWRFTASNTLFSIQILMSQDDWAQVSSTKCRINLFVSWIFLFGFNFRLGCRNEKYKMK